VLLRRLLLRRLLLRSSTAAAAQQHRPLVRTNIRQTNKQTNILEQQ